MCKSTRMPLVRALMGCALSLVFSAGAYADDFHYVNILIGDRAVGMGGAYTAISDDAAGAIYNPAGLVYGTGSNLAASVNAFSNTRKTYKGALTSTSGKKHDWEQESSVLLPNFFGATYDTSVGTIGLTYAVPDSIQRKQQQSFADITSSRAGAEIRQYNLNINDVDHTYLFGPSYAFRVSDNLSLGATLYGSYRDSTVIRNQSLFLRDTDPGDTIDNSNAFQTINGYLYRTEWGVRPILGVMWSPADKWAVGFSASKTWIVSAKQKKQTTINSNVDSDPNTPLFLLEKDEEERDIPFEARLGVAYFPSPALLLSADVSYHSGSGDLIREGQTLRITGPNAFQVVEDELQPVINVALGGEYYLTDKLALRGGLYTDFANTEDIRKDGVTVDQPEHVDIFGGTLSLTRFTRSTSATLGIGYAYGKGEAQIVSGSPRVQDLEINNFMAFLSAAYNF